jgi:hypothetical protein
MAAELVEADPVQKLLLGLSHFTTQSLGALEGRRAVATLGHELSLSYCGRRWILSAQAASTPTLTRPHLGGGKTVRAFAFFKITAFRNHPPPSWSGQNVDPARQVSALDANSWIPRPSLGMTTVCGPEAEHRWRINRAGARGRHCTTKPCLYGSRSSMKMVL